MNGSNDDWAFVVSDLTRVGVTVSGWSEIITLLESDLEISVWELFVDDTVKCGILYWFADCHSYITFVVIGFSHRILK